jgi:hypothetical protein
MAPMSVRSAKSSSPCWSSPLIALDRLGRAACRHPGARGLADLPQEATDLRLATAGERSDTSLAEPASVPVKDHLAELGAALANQLVRPQAPLGHLFLESHAPDSNYYRGLARSLAAV